MSNWSSFEKDKIATDAWRSYLNEGFAASAMQALTAPVGAPRTGIRPSVKKGVGIARGKEEEEEEEETSPDEEGEETPFPPVTDAWPGSPEEGPIEVPDGEDPSDLPDTPEDPYGPDGREDDEDAEEEEAIARAREKEESLNIKLKTMFGAAMDIGGLASFMPGPGQGIAVAATAASLLNNLTFPQPKYGWAAVDLAGLALAVIPGGTALSKASILGIKAKKAANAAKLAKAAKAADTGADVYKAAKALVAYGTLEEELSEELGEAFAQTIKGLLIKKDDEGNYYSTQAIQNLKSRADRDSKGFQTLSAFEEKVEELQRRTELIDQAPADKLDEAQIKHWQVLAGIKKSVI